MKQPPLRLALKIATPTAFAGQDMGRSALPSRASSCPFWFEGKW